MTPTRKRAARFKISVAIDHQNRKGATITIAPNGVVTVRPYHRRETYSLPLEEVARIIILRVARARAEHGTPARAVRRRRSASL